MSYLFKIILIVMIAVIGMMGFLLWKSSKVSDAIPTSVSVEASAEEAKESLSPEPSSTRWKPLTDDTVSTAERLELARQISTGLERKDVEFLFTSMQHTPRAGGEEAWWVVMNEIMEQMRKHGVGAEFYSERLGDLIADSSQSEIVRDYSIQHLTQWLAPPSPDVSPGESDSEKRDKALETIVRTIQNPSSLQTCIPGTGIMALVDISPRLETGAEKKIWERLEPFLSEVISGTTEAQISTRVSAIQAVGIRAEARYLPVIRQLAQAEGSDPSLRISSIAALGFYGDPQDQDLLRSIATSSSPFQYAARAALQRLTSR